MIGLKSFGGSESGLSGQHFGREFAVAVRLSPGITIGNVGGEEVEGLTSFGFKTFAMCSIGTADVATSREEAKPMIKARGSIENPNAVSKVNIQVCEGSKGETHKGK